MNNEDHRIGIDIGGTHTDMVVEYPDGSLLTYKVPTTPKRLSKGVINALEKASSDQNIHLTEFLDRTNPIIHGTTVTTNALLENDLAKTGLLTSEGFRDVIEFNMSRDEEPYNLRSEHKQPGKEIIPRKLRRSVDGRIDRRGNIMEELDIDQIHEKIEELLEAQNCETIAISLMNSYLNNNHEKKVESIARDFNQNIHVSCSSDVFSQMGLYDRTIATVIDASLKPILRQYIKDLESKLRETGYEGAFLIMKGNGGVSSPEVIMDMPITSVNSGPAAATRGTAFTGEVAGFNNIISIDMGGTSTDSCLIRDCEPLVTTDNKVGSTPVPTPMVNIHTIGAGGGSIASLDERDVLQIGPKSAGSDPGPICYGKGGLKPTITDANLLLGYLNPGFFLGGDEPLKKERTYEVIQNNLAEPLNLSVRELCAGIFKLTNEQLYNQIRQVSIQHGYDPREFALVAVGGAGPVHAGALAKRLETTVLIPRMAGTLSAFGLLQSDIRHNSVRSITPKSISDSVVSTIRDELEDMRSEVIEILTNEGLTKGEWEFLQTISTRYRGQVHHVGIKIAADDSPVDIRQRHHDKHNRLYNFEDTHSDIEIVNIQLTAIANTEKPRHSSSPNHVSPQSALKNHREAYFEGPDEFISTPVYDGQKNISVQFNGPAIIELPHTTIVVPTSMKAKEDSNDNFVITPIGSEKQ